MDNTQVGGRNIEPGSAGNVFDSTNRGVETTRAMGVSSQVATEATGTVETSEQMKPTVAAEEFASEIRPFGEATNKNLGGSAIVTEGIFEAPPAPEVVAPGVASEVGAETALEADARTEMQNEAARENTVIKPLVEDGSTEKKSTKKYSLVDGVAINKTLKEKIEKQIKDNEGDPFSLDNVRNEWMAKVYKDDEGRIFGDDGNENIGQSPEVALDKQGGSKAA